MPERAPGSLPAFAFNRVNLTSLLAFVAVGGVSALSYVILVQALFLLNLPVADWALGAGCYALFIGPTYLAHRRLSFKSETSHAVALPRYIAVQAMAVCAAALFSFVSYRVLGFSSFAGSALVIIATSALSFVAMRFWAFVETGSLRKWIVGARA